MCGKSRNAGMLDEQRRAFRNSASGRLQPLSEVDAEAQGLRRFGRPAFDWQWTVRTNQAELCLIGCYGEREMVRHFGRQSEGAILTPALCSIRAAALPCQ